MEDFRGITEELFPSFLTNSLLGNSGTLENVTIASNLGLPVAVSTLAKNRPNNDNRYTDAQASFLAEERFSLPSESSPSSQSETEPKERLQLSFQDDEKKSCTKSRHVSGSLLSESAFHSDGARKEKEQDKIVQTVNSPQSQDLFNRISPLEQEQDSPIVFCLPSWMNNMENKITLPDTGKHFEEKILNSDLPHASLLENEKLVSLSSMEDSSDDDIDDEEFYDDHLEAYFEQLAIPGMIYEDLEGQGSSEKDFKLPTNDSSQANENSNCSSKFQSENNGSLLSHGSYSLGISERPHKKSEEDHIVCVPGTIVSLFSSGSLRSEEKQSAENLKSTVSDFRREEGSLHDNKSLASNSEIALPVDSCLDTETSKSALQKPMDLASSEPISDNGMNSSDTLQSPASKRQICEHNKTIEKSNDQMDLKKQSVVYQNEEGKWVTDLAYYTSFNNEQDISIQTNEMNEDFQCGSEALDLIAHDEEEFNKEHQFMQEEIIDTQNTSLVQGDKFWRTSVNYSLLRKSPGTSDTDNEDSSYLHLSLGEFFAQRSEALGCLGGGYNVKRPSFGYFITSPEMREPVALIRKSVLSGSELEKETSQLGQEQISGDAHERSRSQPSEGSVTLQAEDLETDSQVDENDVTLTTQKGRTEDTFFISSKPRRDKSKLDDGDDSVLRISTIASAIANASVSTDPFQFAAMIKALSNKPREENFQDDDKPKDCSTLSSFLPNDLERSNGSNVFDMEKYLKKTEVSRYEGGLENFSRAGVSSIWNLSLPKEQSVQEISSVHLGAADVSTRKSGENTAATSHGGNGQSKSQETLRTVEPSGPANTSERESTKGDGMTQLIDHRVPSIGTGEKATTSVSIPSSNSTSLERSSRIASLWLCEEFQNKSGKEQRQNEHVNEISNSEKHVAFDKQSILSPKIVDLKNNSSKHGVCISEDELDSFRPSTLPLSHSSPSETSGTSLPGCALESFDSAAPPQRSARESEPCPSMRLTYVSDWESTSPNTVTPLGLEDRKSNITSELSTTFIRAGPVPLEEQGVEKFRDEVSFSSGGQGALALPLQKNEDVDKVGATPLLKSQSEALKPALRLRKTLTLESGANSEMVAVGVTSDPSEEVNQVVQSRAGLGHPARPGPAHPTPSLPVSVEEGPKNNDSSAAHNLPSGQTLDTTAPGSHCPSLLSTVGPDAIPQRQGVPTEVPALSTQHPVPTLPFALKYLGAVPSTGNAALPLCHASSSAVCGLLGSCPYPPVTGEQVHNSVALGICLGQNVSSGLLGSSSVCDLYSHTLDQNLLSTANHLPVQSVGANYAVERWDSEVISESGKVRVPEELKFPHACCLGIASQTVLSLLNPTDRWLQVSIGVLSVSINNEKVDLSTHPCLVFKNKAIIRPYATEDMKILFIPCSAGIFRCIFSVASWRFSADADTIMQAEALASRVVLTAIAEAPMIEVETEKKDGLDFGDIIYGGWKALPLKLINKTHASVPIRLLINANALAWRCFTLSKDPILASLKAAPYADVLAQLATPSVINLMMPASSEGQDPESQTVWVLFHSPKKQISSSEVLDSAEEFLASVDIEVDSPNPTPVIKSVALRARTGIARIHAPKDLQTMHLFASVTSSTKQHLPLKNAGNIGVSLDIKISDQGSDFSVDPEKLFLKPGEEYDVLVSFTPKDPKPCEERVLKIFVQPFGPQYEVALKGEVVSLGTNPPTSEPGCSVVPSILSNKQFLTWGGVPLGITQLQKLTLRNNSASETQHLRLVIRGQDQDCFQLQHTFGSEERLTSNCEIRIRPKEDINISVLFTPTRLSCMLAKLEIKNLGIRSQPGIKFTIPLSGYGGTSNLILENVKKLSDSYMVTVKDLIPGQECRVVFSVRNTGSRAAFVKVVGFKDSQKKLLLDPQVLSILPNKFVLKERTQEDVTIIYNPSDRECNYQTTTEMSTIYFFSGDEILRQRFRRALLHKPEILEQILPENNMLHNIDFAETFEDELLVTEVYDFPQRPNDIQLFYGNMRKMVLSVIGEFKDSVSRREFVKFSTRASLESQSSGKHGGSISLDVLPVKGPQGSPLSQAVHPPQDKSDPEETLTVQPEHLILVVPSPSDLARTGHFQILNHSTRLLRFELYWPAHCLTVTPQHGFISPESKLQILVSPNSSLSTNQSMIPWNGVIYVHCDNGQKKVVKVQIREDLAQEELTRFSTPSFGIMNTGALSHLTKLLPKPPSTKVEIRNKSVTFPTTEPGNTSENCLELENRGNTEVKWHLSSLAPPYVKGVDESGDVFRATYAAFICSPISGILESHGIQKVSITFLPRDRGDYAQFWDVECHPLKESHMKHTLRFQLTGQSVKAENKPVKSSSSTSSLIKIDNLVKPQRRAVSETSAVIPNQLDLTHRGVYAPKDVYCFLPTRVGESKTLKINLRNNSFITHMLKFLSPREPFYVKHSKYSLRAQHYINMPIQFKPKSAGKFDALLVIQTDENKSIAIRLFGEALGKN
ncbi:centrosomal protein of 192 kDa [Sorex fumeus]|uniref:centrosomal protein of 192 kDa n=1 Tax=Sorex fumeus TaxID=62283 RepID=UPI0024ACC057|nr:centrosomal protein of 192 kDa [Sorex fumeus]